MQFLSTHDPLRHFCAKLLARVQTHVGQTDIISLTVVDPPRFGREPTFECALPKDRPSFFCWNDIRMAAGRQKEVLEGRHLVDDPSCSSAQVYSFRSLHEISVGRRLPRGLVVSRAQDDSEMRQAEMFNRPGQSALEVKTWREIMLVSCVIDAMVGLFTHSEAIPVGVCFSAGPTSVRSPRVGENNQMRQLVRRFWREHPVEHAEATVQR